LRFISPNTVEECLVAFGLKERNDEIEVVMSVNLMADICTRLIRLEDLCFLDLLIEEEDE
jgi:hypothetical protein